MCCRFIFGLNIDSTPQIKTQQPVKIHPTEINDCLLINMHRKPFYNYVYYSIFFLDQQQINVKIIQRENN